MLRQLSLQADVFRVAGFVSLSRGCLWFFWSEVFDEVVLMLPSRTQPGSVIIPQGRPVKTIASKPLIPECRMRPLFDRCNPTAALTPSAGLYLNAHFFTSFFSTGTPSVIGIITAVKSAAKFRNRIAPPSSSGTCISTMSSAGIAASAWVRY